MRHVCRVLDCGQYSDKFDMEQGTQKLGNMCLPMPQGDRCNRTVFMRRILLLFPTHSRALRLLRVCDNYIGLDLVEKMLISLRRICAGGRPKQQVMVEASLRESLALCHLVFTCNAWGEYIVQGPVAVTAAYVGSLHAVMKMVPWSVHTGLEFSKMCSMFWDKLCVVAPKGVLCNVWP